MKVLSRLGQVFAILLLAAFLIVMFMYIRGDIPQFLGSVSLPTTTGAAATAQPTTAITSLPPKASDVLTAVEPSQLVEQTTPAIQAPSSTDIPGTAAPQNTPAQNALAQLPVFDASVSGAGYAVCDGLYTKFDPAALSSVISQMVAARSSAFNDAYSAALKKSKKTQPTDVAVPDIALTPVYQYQWVRVPVPSGKYPGGFTVAGNSAPLLSCYMGYILYASGPFSLQIQDNTGAALAPAKNPADVKLPGLRDAAGVPLFAVNGGYGTLSADGTFAPSAYDPNTDFRGVYGQYPSWYGAQTDPLSRYQASNGLWGFKDPTGKVVIRATYKYAYNFSEGIACVVTTKSVVQFINASGTRLFKTNYYVPPTDPGAATMGGYYYYDHGLVCVWARNYDLHGVELVSQGPTVIRADGSAFGLPQDYTLVDYSCGVFLLTKDGKYGYMNYNGDWIAQPVYTSATPFSEGVAVLGFGSGSMGVIDTSGNIVLPFAFDYITPCSGGVMLTYDKADGWSIINKVRRSIPYSLPEFVYPAPVPAGS